MTIAMPRETGVPNAQIARMLEVTDGAVRYHADRGDAVNGRSFQIQRATRWADVTADWMGRNGSSANLAAMHCQLVQDHGYVGSLRSVQRYVGKHLPKPQLRARRRVETPHGVQSQADWGKFLAPCRWSGARSLRVPHAAQGLAAGPNNLVDDSGPVRLATVQRRRVPASRGCACVGIDCMASLESRQYSVPFAYVGQTVQVRSCRGPVHALASYLVLATRPRHTDPRIVIDLMRLDGNATDRIRPPQPLGSMGLRL